MDVVVTAGGFSTGLGFLLPTVFHVLGSAGHLPKAGHFGVSLDPSHHQRIHVQDLRVRHEFVHKLLPIHLLDDILGRGKKTKVYLELSSD